MYEFILNGEIVNVIEDMNLLEYLREEARITSVKNGCGEGACGACMVLVNGKATRACILTIAKVSGKEVLTVEGLSPWEKEVYAWAFAEAGAVQCGFCTPGMIISAKGLLDKNQNPTSAEIKKALQGNICRCTGYVKIEKAVAMAAQVLREGSLPRETSYAGVGGRLQRVDARDKVLGRAQYVDDMKVEGMLYAAVLRTPYPRARVKRIDISQAQKLEGVVAVLKAQDIPGERFLGHIVHDWPALIAEGEETRYIGDALVLVAATSKKAAREALQLIDVSYEVLPPLLTTEQALAEDAPKIHPGGNILSKTKLSRGDVEKAIAKAKYVVTQRYTTPPTEHAFLEPESALAVPGEDGTITIYTADQNVYDDQRGIIALLGLSGDKVRVISQYVGGAFGGKEDLSVQHHAALLAWHTQKPVKLTLSRQESIFVHPKRHPMEMEFTTACDEKGKITAVKAKLVADTGAYASLGGPVLQRACTHAAGPYQIDNIHIEGLAVYTNNPPNGAFRGFGVTQSCFAMESNLNLLAAKVGISPWEIRYRNAIEPGKVLPNGQIADEGTAFKETLLAVREFFDSSPYAGIACAMKNSGLGVGVPDTGRVKLKVEKGNVIVLTAAACIGQGLATVLTQIVYEITGISASFIKVAVSDTALAADSGTTTASRQTLFTGEAARQAAFQLKAKLANSPLEELEGEEFFGSYTGVTDPFGSNKANPVSHVAYSYATHVAILDEEGKVNKLIAAHDVGRAINPNGIEGQIEGGVVMGLGYALTENFPLKNGIPTAKFGNLGLFRATKIPEIKTMIIEKNQSALAFGAKGIGEISSIPTAPAVAGAYLRYDGKHRTNLPLVDTPYRK